MDLREAILRVAHRREAPTQSAKSVAVEVDAASAMAQDKSTIQAAITMFRPIKNVLLVTVADDATCVMAQEDINQTNF